MAVKVHIIVKLSIPTKLPSQLFGVELNFLQGPVKEVKIQGAASEVKLRSFVI